MMKNTGHLNGPLHIIKEKVINNLKNLKIILRFNQLSNSIYIALIKTKK